MKERSIADQRRIIRTPNNPEETRVPTMPILVVLDNGIIGEAKTIRGAASIVIGDEYLDIDDGATEWHARVQAARREIMKVLAQDIDAVVYDSRLGIIDNNYAAAHGDPDYIDDSNESARLSRKIRVENDRLFILSLLDMGSIRVMERADSYMLRPHNKWEKEKLSGGALQCCGRCLHAEEQNESIICPVYNVINGKTDGPRCGSYTPRPTTDVDNQEYKGGEYIDLAQAYDVNELMRTVGQEWILESEKTEK